MSNNTYLKTLRSLYRELQDQRQHVAAMDDAEFRIGPSAPMHPESPAHNIRRILAVLESEYAAHAALRPDLATEFEIRAELQDATTRADTHQRTISRITQELERLDRLPPIPTPPAEPSPAAHQQAAQRLADAVARLAAPGLTLRESRTLPATVERLRTLEGRTFLALTRARERHAKNQPPDRDAIRRRLTDDRIDALDMLDGAQSEIAHLSTLLPAGTARAPLRASKANGLPRARRTGMRHAAHDPQGLADQWAQRIGLDAFARYTYAPDTGRLTGPRRVLDPVSDTVPIRDVLGVLCNVPKGVVIAIIHLKTPFYLLPTTGPDDPTRWAWRHLVARTAGRDTMHATVPASSLGAHDLA